MKLFILLMEDIFDQFFWKTPILLSMLRINLEATSDLVNAF